MKCHFLRIIFGKSKKKENPPENNSPGKFSLASLTITLPTHEDRGTGENPSSMFDSILSNAAYTSIIPQPLGTKTNRPRISRIDVSFPRFQRGFQRLAKLASRKHQQPKLLRLHCRASSLHYDVITRIVPPCP